MEKWIRYLLTEELKIKALNLFSTDAEKFEVVRFFENFVFNMNQKKKDGLSEKGVKNFKEIGHRLRNGIDLFDMDFEKYLK